MSSAEVLPSAIDSGIDRKTLKTIKQRFLQVNNARLARTRSALGARQQIFLDLLPLIFHVNHPMLPGYVSHQTPCGVTDYNPSKVELQKAQRLARSFTYRRQPAIRRQIHGLFLMGSCGTVAQSDSSDLDIWLCHPSNLKAEEVLQLRQKTEQVSRWAETLGLEAHFFLMEDEKFRQGLRESLTTEDCGSTQHYLLLDEFYRTGLLIAGRIPLWWLVPPDEEAHYDAYATNLKHKRYIRAQDSVDFGGVGHIPAGEFIGAGVWQLYKAIDSPYKSVLKILLTEVYADEFPEVEPLSTSFKRAIYQNQLDIDELDPYVVVYRKLENYLKSRNEQKRLELVRRCFYFKVGKSLSRPSRSNAKSWQRRLMEKLVAEWQWPREHLYSLDVRHRWKIGRVVAEQKELVRELTSSYRAVLEFARRTRASAMINSSEMTVLGRKLYAAFERKAGKIEWINPGIAKNLAEETLTFYYAQGDRDEKPLWGVTNENLAPHILRDSNIDRTHFLKRSEELTSLLAWCHFNGLLDSATQISIVEGDHAVNDYELNSMLRAMRQKLPVARQYAEDGDEKHDRFHQPVHTAQLQLFINVGKDPLEHIRNQGIERLSAHTDSLGYSGLRENLIVNVEQVLVNSWGEVFCRRYDGENALLRCVQDYLHMLPPARGTVLPQLDIRCFCPTRATAISKRVEELFRDIVACYYSGTRPPCSRYIMEVQREFFVLQFEQHKPTIEQLPNYKALLRHLSQPQQQYSPIVLDRYCLNHSVLAAISEQIKADQIQVFFQRQDDHAQVYIADEMGSLFFQSTPFHDEHSLLAPLDQFIQSTLLRRSSESSQFVFNEDSERDSGGFDLSHFDYQKHDIDYYEIHDSSAGVQLSPHNIIEQLSGSHFFNVQAIADRDFDGKLWFTIFCDQQEFSELELGEALYDNVARYILSQRASGERYPCYITDLDLSRGVNQNPGSLTQTAYYLRHKSKLEKALNLALQRVK